MSDADATHMRQALAVGSRGLGRVWPNPSVGCVIVKDGQIVGRGWTQDGGRPHGEVMALAQAGDRARGATVYVTLEPCSHTGQTPPCAAALIKAGVARVVVAMLDPDPRVNGQGVALLRNAGIEVEVGTCSHETSEQHAGFIKKIKSGRPMVTLKLASSFDGRIATASGESQWITGPIARRLVHAQRARHDAVMVGGGTARKDDPSLTVRGLGIARQPVRVVWSRQLDLPLQGQLAASAQQVPLWIVHAEGADATLCDLWRGLGAKLLPVGCGADRQIDPAQALTALAGAGLTRVYCEGGGAMAASLLRADLVDELVNFTAGLGLGADGLAAIAPLGLAHLAAAQRFDLVETVPVGPDVMSRWRRRA